MLRWTPLGGGPSVRMEGVTHRYGRTPSLKGVDLEIESGEFTYLVGPSASGKTTLLKLMHGEERPTAGRIWLDGELIGRRRSNRRRVSVVFQEYRLLERRTALENIMFALRVRDLSLRRSEVAGRALTALADCGLAMRASAYPSQLSGGQRQRLAIARALAAQPLLLLADEPTASLDVDNARRVTALLRKIAARGTTVIVATHDRDLVAARPNRVIRLSEGEVVPADEPQERWASG